MPRFYEKQENSRENYPMIYRYKKFTRRVYYIYFRILSTPIIFYRSIIVTKHVWAADANRSKTAKFSHSKLDCKFFLSFHFDFRYSETGNKNMQLVCNTAAKRVEKRCSVFAPTFKPIVQQISLLQKEERSSTISNKICTFSVFYRTKVNLLNSK